MIWDETDEAFNVVPEGDHEERLRKALVGRRILKAEKFENENGTSARFHLDNDKVLEVHASDGGCACSAGDYWVDEIDTADGAVIMNVESVEDPAGDDDYSWNGETSDLSTTREGYKLFVYAEGVGKRQLYSMAGDDGNGYYGTGYSVYIREGGSAV